MMTNRIATPNTHAVWDPAWAGGLVQTHFAAQIDLGRELVRYAADLLLRALQSGPEDIGNRTLLSVLGRQAVVALDASLACLESGAVDAAEVHARTLMEARWGLMYALKDPAKWGRHLYVASLRQQRHWTSRLIVGTPEYHQYEDARNTIPAFDPTDMEKQVEYTSYVEAIDRILSDTHFADVSRQFEAFYAAHHREAEWYYDESRPRKQRVTSLARLASAVGCKGEYQTVYKHSSYYVHGSYAGIHVKHEPGALILAPVRTPENWRQVYILSLALGSDVMRRVIDTYRVDELPQFVKKYVEGWRERLRATPSVHMHTAPRIV